MQDRPEWLPLVFDEIARAKTEIIEAVVQRRASVEQREDTDRTAMDAYDTAQRAARMAEQLERDLRAFKEIVQTLQQTVQRHEDRHQALDKGLREELEKWRRRP